MLRKHLHCLKDYVLASRLSRFQVELVSVNYPEIRIKIPTKMLQPVGKTYSEIIRVAFSALESYIPPSVSKEHSKRLVYVLVLLEVRRPCGF